MSPRRGVTLAYGAAVVVVAVMAPLACVLAVTVVWAAALVVFPWRSS